MIKNEKIKASEVHVTGINGEDLGIMPTAEALKLAKQLKVDLVCTSLLSSPPPCQLIGAGAARQKQQQEAKRERPAKLKEIRLTASIEDHDYETKQQQARRLLQSGHPVMLVVKTGNNKESAAARKLLEDLVRDLKAEGRPATGIQVSGKQSMVQLDPLS
ncbi:translation initiation factor IF-3 [Paenibacillus hunanensis]|uniref:Translation initiation factor IF-3 n=1 Tax=Paenibacillus hunanensis TaxID=539262 RepID=A0ABU1J0F8_9BACL|nr:translation initiation factor IF-3 [Paenibacillus hunanensis]MCL9659597.1 translation initiation factor IF-3 [Paenibacillus hunanensis]MDR6244963.1 translation initiation factor IF-3 [Paenibacillus hunanensis]GGI95662.1 translation initiation factor IF-3 [Paenibacillus hunanensis]